MYSKFTYSTCLVSFVLIFANRVNLLFSNLKLGNNIIYDLYFGVSIFKQITNMLHIAIKNDHTLLKNKNIVKNRITNINNILKYDNKSTDTNIKV